MKLLHGECLAEMASIEEKSIDLIATDLPYGTTQNRWDHVIDMDEMWKSFWRILKPNGAVVLTAAQPFAAMLIMSQPKHFKYDLIWSKNKSSGFLNAKKQPLRSHESILVFYRKPCTYNPQMTDGHKPGNYAKRTQQSENYGTAGASEYGGSTFRYPKSVLDIAVLNNDSKERLHPTQKPVELMEWIVRTYSNEGDTVLDCTMGSGTTGIACLNSGREFVGIEMGDEYFEKAEKRIREHERSISPPSLFD